MHHIYLSPGFFGFANLGGLTYFDAVADTLRKNLTAAGQACRIFEVATIPTGSLRRRSERLFDTIREQGSLEEDCDIHLLGHSTGGLDGRMLAARIDGYCGDGAGEALAARLRTVVSVATPHHGTPLATFFATTRGQELLQHITLLIITGLRGGGNGQAATLLRGLSLATELLGLEEPLLHQLNQQLLRELGPEEQRAVRQFLQSIHDDTSLLVQLTPESADLLDQLLSTRSGVRYVSYAAVSPAPREALWRTTLAGRCSPLSSYLYGLLYGLAGGSESSREPAMPAMRDLVTGRPMLAPLTAASNDGVVPTLSQALGGGELRGCVEADHLDVIGHYLHSGEDADWLASGARFDHTSFLALWGDVSEVILG